MKKMTALIHEKKILRTFRFSFVLIAMLIMASCNQQQLETQQEEITQLTEENEILRKNEAEKEAHLNEFFETMSLIRDNLNEIKVRQNLISEETRDRDQIGPDARQQIEDDLKLISDLMEDNRKRLAALNRQIRDSNVKIKEFETLVASLTSEIEEKNVEISQLRDSMNELNIYNAELTATIDKLEEDNIEKLQLIEEKIEQLNTAYYVFGTRKELQEQEIIDRQGGILGIGRTTVVSPDVNTEYFTRVNISQIDKVVVPASSLKLVSTHPKDSYFVETTEDEGTQIVIENPEKFWSNTKYLVVSID
jgi:cell division protein FtsB